MNNSKPEVLRVLIADDHAMILEMFKQFLSALPDFEALTAPDLDAALAQIDSAGPFDLVLVDLDMPGMDGIAGLSKAIDRNGGKPVGILTSNPTPHVVSETLSMGGAGIVLKTESLKNLTNEIRFMAAGGRYVPVELIDRQRVKTRENTGASLSEREMTVLALLAEGKPNREIGTDLGLAEATVKMHVKSICSKLGANNRTQAVIVARDNGIF
ncbi:MULTISPECIES: response regulator transcription factor [Roseobacteraceae]|jgi:DNA-binding NarL/FixJ family response regulator|uniref:Transcriptional regulatory protein DegU n=1 Tax=Pseudosulfitobacter pseudonitzschiae TaxID=1402135 RepID=A0A221K7E9_9RHOB|nr:MULTISPECIES: response regulator transcription factor [Roseobacteraceae]ASM74938.1 transcriptional regulatory protein DegU [Pseudosulfitobacter pseudonitzschiae]